ncbi:MAG: glycogen synthase GlgA [Vicinamibacterales bacterium]
MVSPEAAPFAKTGGLGDVAGALPQALGRLGHRVTLVLPRYRGIDSGSPIDQQRIWIAGRPFDVGYFEHPLAERARAIFVDVPELYDRPGLYNAGGPDYPDNAIRFALLSRAALELGARTDDEWRPSLVHAHEWQTGLVPVYLKTYYARHPRLAGLPAVFTIHNLAFQGLFPAETMPLLDLGWELYTTAGLEFWGRMSFLKGGVNFADRITTVSPRYAREIVTPELGFRFDGILRARQSVLSGILNGIDVEAWNPETDPHLPVHYGPSNLDAKRQVKQALLERFRLPADDAAVDRPLIGLVSRMTDQKGFDLLGAAVTDLLALDATFALVGSGEARYERQWSRLAAQRPARVGARIGFDEPLAHLIVGGADMFLMPSRFEPCGLNQMYCLRYGTVPLVRATGGLADTVTNHDEKTGKGNGFTFEEYRPRALVGAVGRALTVFNQNRQDWRALQLAGMEEDHSWDVSAREYVKVYRALFPKASAASAKRRAPASGSGFPQARRTTAGGQESER